MEMDYSFGAPEYHDFVSPLTEVNTSSCSDPAAAAAEVATEVPSVSVVTRKASPTSKMDLTTEPEACDSAYKSQGEPPIEVSSPSAPSSVSPPPTGEKSRTEPEDLPPLHLEEGTAAQKKSDQQPHSGTSGRTTHRSGTPTRQSDRLAAIAKSVRRSNANRGLLPSPKVSSSSSGTPRGRHRRSLSEGSNILTHFSKVEKKQHTQRRTAVVRPTLCERGGPPPPPLADADLGHLEGTTTQYQKLLSQNRARASQGPSAARGPLKTGGPILKKGDEEHKDFTHTLRSNAGTSSHHPRGPTKVQPFNLHDPAKPKEAPKPFFSMAELSLKFHTKTPQRFRTKRYNPNEPLPDLSKKARANPPGGVTHPKTPNLSTRARARSVDYPSREEVEAKEMEEAQKHQFKARPANKKILSEPQLKPVEAKGTRTAADGRASRLGGQEGGACEEPPFVARRGGMLAGLSSCSLASVPHGGVSTQWHKKSSTEPKPFSFDARDSEAVRKKKEHIAKLLEEERKLSEFQAQPMPVFERGVQGLPPRRPPTPTKVQPFRLASDARGAARQEAIHRELEELAELEKRQRRFEAQSDSILRRKPFQPEKSHKALTDISGFSLNTDRRAAERGAFEAHLKHKEDVLLAERRQAEERKEAEEEAAALEQRRQAVHKAQPVRHYKPVLVTPGLLPPTVPLSPHFATDLRLRGATTQPPPQLGAAQPCATPSPVHSLNQWGPSNISTSDTFKLAFNFPQAKPEDVKVTLKDRLLTVEMKVEESSATTKVNQSLSLQYTVPESVDVQLLESKISHDGVLTIQAPKTPDEAPTTININRE